MHVTIDNQYRIADDALPNGGDSTTLVTEVIRNIRPEIDFDFHLPFDSTGEADTSLIWPLWMRNSLDSLHEQAGGRPLDDVNMWIASNPDAKWEYYDMTQGWVDFLIGQGYPVEEYEYSGFSGDEVIQDEYLFDLLREMLIFHSNNFGD